MHRHGAVPLILLASGLAGAGLAGAGRAAAQSAAAAPAKQVLSVIDEDPIASARASAMGGALGTLADDLDAAFHNPAGIGGLGNPGNVPFVRKLYFPEVTAAANQNSSQLFGEMKKSGATSNAAVGEAVLDANAGKRDYARANIVTGAVLGRALLAPFEDVQMATSARGQGTNLIDTTYRNMAGLGLGLSAQDKEGRLSVGYFGYAASRTDTVGALSYSDFIDQTARTKALKDNTQKSTGFGNNAGVIWRLGKGGAPTIGLNVKNAGGTRFRGAGGTLTVKQQVDAAFSLSPHVGKSGVFNVVVEADHLSDADLAFVKKYKLGAELCLGGIGSYATLALRAGYNYAGPSAGLRVSLGLVGLEAGVYAVDVAADNARVIDRRGVATAFVNVASF